jgi:fructosamine-3-kinase
VGSFDHAVGVRSPTQRDVDRLYVLAAAATAFGDAATVVHAEPFTGGSFGSVWRVELADRGPVVLKISATPDAGLLTYERGMLAEEANYLRTAAAGAPELPVARVLHQAQDWLFMTLLPGTPLPFLPPDTDTTRVREECGAAIARLHRVSGDLFGYPGDRPNATSWPDAFTAMIEAILHDAVVWGVPLPLPPDRVRAVVRTHRGLLAAVTRPAFVHFDLWDGNVLASVDDDGARLSGLVDGERYLFGDPLVDLASPALFADVLDPPGHPFLRGYMSVTPLMIDEGVRRRVWLYQLYLYLIMIVEYPSRGMTPGSDPGRWALLGRLVIDLVDRLTGGDTDPGQ